MIRWNGKLYEGQHEPLIELTRRLLALRRGALRPPLE
jgi:hypothetical protein